MIESAKINPLSNIEQPAAMTPEQEETMLDSAANQQIAKSSEVESLEAFMLDLPQAECPVIHHFGPGTYIREVNLPAGILAIGHAQRFEQLNIMLTGKVAILDTNGEVKELVAPLIFVGPPGRKVGYVIEPTVWLNVYATEERDIDKLEEMFLDKSDSWAQHHAENHAKKSDVHEEDRKDFFEVIKQAGFSPETVREQSENLEDQMEMPDGYGAKVTIRPSAIEGKGVFLSASAEAGELIAPARINGMRTPVGRYTNHSVNPNAKFILSDTNNIYLVATKYISGCKGGDFGEEVTVDYRQALELSGFSLPNKGEEK